MKITAIEIVDLANIPVKPPLFKDPVRSSAKLVKVETDEGLIGVSHIVGPTPIASAALIKEELTPFLKGKDPLETERLMHHMLWRFNSRGPWGHLELCGKRDRHCSVGHQGEALQDAGLAAAGRRPENTSRLHHLWSTGVFKRRTR